MRKPTARPPVRPGPATAVVPDIWTQTFGTSETVEWITSRSIPGRTVTTAIPPVFERYAVVDELDVEDDLLLVEQERALVRVLADFGPRAWWLGYLDTGAHDVVFPDAKKVELYAGWSYVVVRAGPDEALTWRDSPPDLIFPTDRSWFVSMLWDDGWTCLGGPAGLVDELLADPLLRARPVQPGIDIAPLPRLADGVDEASIRRRQTAGGRTVGWETHAS